MHRRDSRTRLKFEKIMFLCVLKDLKNAQFTNKLFLFVHCHYLMMMMCLMNFDDVRTNFV